MNRIFIVHCTNICLVRNVELWQKNTPSYRTINQQNYHPPLVCATPFISRAVPGLFLKWYSFRNEYFSISNWKANIKHYALGEEWGKQFFSTHRYFGQAVVHFRFTDPLPQIFLTHGSLVVGTRSYLLYHLWHIFVLHPYYIFKEYLFCIQHKKIKKW